jgi:hypothetical protein
MGRPLIIRFQDGCGIADYRVRTAGSAGFSVTDGQESMSRVYTAGDR